MFKYRKQLEEQVEKQRKALDVLRKTNSLLHKEVRQREKELYDKQLEVEELEIKMENLKNELERNPYNNYEMIVRRCLQYINDAKIKELV